MLSASVFWFLPGKATASSRASLRFSWYFCPNFLTSYNRLSLVTTIHFYLFVAVKYPLLVVKGKLRVCLAEGSRKVIRIIFLKPSCTLPFCKSLRGGEGQTEGESGERKKKKDEKRIPASVTLRNKCQETRSCLVRVSPKSMLLSLGHSPLGPALSAPPSEQAGHPPFLIPAPAF